MIEQEIVKSEEKDIEDVTIVELSAVKHPANRKNKILQKAKQEEDKTMCKMCKEEEAMKDSELCKECDTKEVVAKSELQKAQDELEVLKKSQEDAKIELQKAQDEVQELQKAALLKAADEQVSKWFNVPMEKTELTDLFLNYSKEKFIKLCDAVEKALEKPEAFKEIGSSQTELVQSATARLDGIVAELQKSGMSKEKAISEAYLKNPGLYNKYSMEKN